VKNVLGNDYDVLLVGDTTSPKTLHQIDATCKAQGYEAKTHPAIDAEEYAALAEATVHVLNLDSAGRLRTSHPLDSSPSGVTNGESVQKEEAGRAEEIG
jgi:hypothetical protein